MTANPSHTMKRFVEYHLADHEVLLNFEDDDGAFAFSDWWQYNGGEELFKEFCQDYTHP